MRYHSETIKNTHHFVELKEIAPESLYSVSDVRERKIASVSSYPSTSTRMATMGTK